MKASISNSEQHFFLCLFGDLNVCIIGWHLKIINRQNNVWFCFILSTWSTGLWLQLGHLCKLYIIFHFKNLYLMILRFNMSTSKWCSIWRTRRLKLIGTRCFHCLWIYVLSWQERVKPSKKRSRSWEKDLCKHSLGASVWQIYLQADIVLNAFWHDDVLGRQVEAPVPGEQ